MKNETLTKKNGKKAIKEAAKIVSQVVTIPAPNMGFVNFTIIGESPLVINAFAKKAQEEMIKKSGQMGVPVVDIDGQIVVGFDKEKICKILKIKD